MPLTKSRSRVHREFYTDSYHADKPKITKVGALALSAEGVIAALIPVFILEYAGLDPRMIRTIDFAHPTNGAAPGSPLSVLPRGARPPDLGRISLLATIPLLTNGVASYLLVPMSTAVGRRPVMLLASTCACAGGAWAALSRGLGEHLAARVLQGLGAGAMEALIPLVVQDMFFLHERNTWMSTIISSQGIIFIALGVTKPYIAANHGWRMIYWITTGFGMVAWALLLLFLPETRWTRSKEELSRSFFVSFHCSFTQVSLPPHLPTYLLSDTC